MPLGASFIVSVSTSLTVSVPVPRLPVRRRDLVVPLPLPDSDETELCTGKTARLSYFVSPCAPPGFNQPE